MGASRVSIAIESESVRDHHSGQFYPPQSYKTAMKGKEFIRAAYFGDLARVQELVQQSVDLDKEEALKAAAGVNHLAVVRYLVGQCGQM